jgi:hypothetical protein
LNKGIAIGYRSQPLLRSFRKGALASLLSAFTAAATSADSAEELKDTTGVNP